MTSQKNFDFDEWSKVIDNHPAFMSSIPNAEGEMPEAFEALQAMKYCDEEDPPEVRAKLFKDDGNRHFQYKKYRNAVEAYTKGIALRCCDKELNASLYGNRAAAQVRLGNLRSAVRDCFLSRKFQPDNIKVIMRGIEAMMALKDCDEVTSWCDDGLNVQQLNEADRTRLETFKSKAKELKKLKTRDERKEQTASRKLKATQMELCQLLKERKVQFWYSSEAEEVENLELSCLDVAIPNVGVRRVAVVEGQLVWPVLFLYPETGQTDHILEFNENSRFRDHLEEVLSEPPPWDTPGHYTLDQVDVFVESFRDEKQLIRVQLNSTLRDVLTSDCFRLKHGLPTFILLSKATPFYTEFLGKFEVC